MTAEYLSCADTAKLIRAQLKARFPGVKFSVRSHTYSGGASIDIDWTDGPTDSQVEEITHGFAGGRFDGMIDMAYNVSSWLEEDGSAHVAENRGTSGSRGMDPGCLGDPRSGGAREVHFGADYVFTHRGYSAELLDWLASFILQNGRTRGERCDGCGNWMAEGDCFTAKGERDRVFFVCSPLCGARREARHFDCINDRVDA